MGYTGLVTELRSTSGAYVHTLQDFWSPEKLDINQIRMLANSYPNIVDFSEKVVELRWPPMPNAAKPERPAAVDLPALPDSPHLYQGETLEPALKHLGRGMKITVYLTNGQIISGRATEYNAGRLWLRTPDTKSFKKDEIRALEAPEI